MDEITWNEVICLIDRIVHEIRMALSHELHLSALALALTLPDTCGKAEYPNEKHNGIRYKNWCSQYVITDRCDSPYVHVLLGKHADTGNVVRNQTAHAGDSAVLTSMYSAMRRS